ncbi:LysR family transcriptional regulator [Nocardioides sp. GY 10127]|uniref:LysR family transcriptional regulator n=1 Tax=Nocardioides sp. GY 10127 TaxID=2569762 RepID=UPI0010A896EF|nr:LysR family transcriptional regulator [Nocardioides sp. GY 10127]TIC79414.1 LysR family transcriptional regulator [Nocardioides sp. GY 10127]
MELRQLRYFVAVADRLSFTGAAQELGVAQSALSTQVARLEREVGTALLLRTSRTVRLTEAGEALRGRARRILDQVDDAREELAELGDARRGRLRVGLAQTASRTTDVLGILGRFHARHPLVEIVTVAEPSPVMAAAVLAGDLDVAVVGGGPQDLPPTLESLLLVEEEQVAAVPRDHPLAAQRSVTLADLLAAGPLVRFRGSSHLRREVDTALAAAGLVPAAGLEMALLEDVVRCVSHGLGVGIVPASTVAHIGDNAGPRPVVGVPLADAAPTHRISLVVHPEHASPVARAFLLSLR